ncbi:Major facilitator superfamily,Major facilitator superfamily domain [Cinara cedri]|uniref:Major facilitator superfamily,Major facilitator superfamily domain n=1 Tax=Cinara cedri TaxID=506608 RepID=A0A5E4M7U8_9HEMI|nr:Major facilitator superfamily,Major facilitator superfamily domain [Cinara cedri]
MAGKIIPKSNRSLYSTFMFSGTIFGGFFGHIFSGLVIPLVSNDGSFFMLSVFGFIWTAMWTTMIHVTPYERTHDASNHSMMLFSTPWSTILQTPSFVSLLVACMGFGYLYSFVTTAIPIYFAKILGGDYIKNGISVSINWLICWLTAIFAGLLAASLTNVNDTSTKTIVRKVYAGIVLILSPMMLLGVMLADCNKSLVQNFLSMSVILLAFERASLRINALDLCPGESGLNMSMIRLK